MKTLFIILFMCAFTFSASAQLVTKSTTSSKTAAKTFVFSNDKADHPFGLQIVLDAANMHANDSILLSFTVSNDGTNYNSYSSKLPNKQLKKTVYTWVCDTVLNYKYFKVTMSPPTGNNDSTFTMYGYLMK